MHGGVAEMRCTARSSRSASASAQVSLACSRAHCTSSTCVYISRHLGVVLAHEARVPQLRAVRLDRALNVQHAHPQRSQPAREAVACVQQQPRGEATDVAGLLRCTNRATRSPGTRCTCMRGCKSARTRSPRAVTAHELTKQLACLRTMGAAVIWRQHAAARM